MRFTSRMCWRWLLIVSLLSLLLAPACAQPTGADAASYDAAPLLSSLRPAERRTVVSEAGLGEANELPLYEMTIDLADDLSTFALDQTLYFRNHTSRSLAEVVLRLYANAVAPDTPPLRVLEVECLDGGACTSSQPSPSALVVRLSRPLAPGARVRIRTRVAGAPAYIDPARTTLMGQGLEGLSMLGSGPITTDYGILSRSDGVMSLGAFHPVLARMRGERWEQSDGSTMGDLGSDTLFHVRARVRTADGVEVVASGVESAPRVFGDRIEHEVRAAFIRDFALVASPRLRTQEQSVGGVTVRSHFLEGHVEPGRWVLDAARIALQTYTRRFGAYPFPELDVVEAPLIGGAGGVELSGMVTVATSFYRPLTEGLDASLAPLLGARAGDMDARRRAMIELVTAHEVAHQYWHGLVGSDSRRHPYQDECLAQYSALLYMEARYGAARAEREAEEQVAVSYRMMRAMGHPDGAVDRPVSAFADSTRYAGLVYGKGPFVYRAVRRVLGDARFFAALREYVRDNRFRVAPPRDLFDRLAQGPHAQQVRALEHRWLDETHGDEDLAAPGGDSGGDPAGVLRGLLGGGGASPSEDAAVDLLRRMLEGGQGGRGPAEDPAEVLRQLLER